MFAGFPSLAKKIRCVATGVATAKVDGLVYSDEDETCATGNTLFFVSASYFLSVSSDISCSKRIAARAKTVGIVVVESIQRRREHE